VCDLSVVFPDSGLGEGVEYGAAELVDVFGFVVVDGCVVLQFPGVASGAVVAGGSGHAEDDVDADGAGEDGVDVQAGVSGDGHDAVAVGADGFAGFDHAAPADVSFAALGCGDAGDGDGVFGHVTTLHCRVDRG